MSLNLFLDFKIKMSFVTVAVFRRMWRWCED